MDIHDFYDKAAQEECEKLERLGEKRKRKGSSKVKVKLPFADIHYSPITDSKDADLGDGKRSDSSQQRFG